MATYAIGDIHGCYDPLQRLLELIHFDPAVDKIWTTGDLVNRGEHSLEILRFFKDLGDQAIAVMGNHDLHLLANAFGNSSRFNPDKDTFQEIFDAPDRNELINWIRNRPFLHHDKALGFTIIHAGLPPQWTLKEAKKYAKEIEKVIRGEKCRDFLQNLYAKVDYQWSDELKEKKRLQFIAACFTRLRYCDENGCLMPKNKLRPTNMQGNAIEGFPWFSHPQRKSNENRIIFGHWAALGLYISSPVYALDSGCVWGGCLTALRLEDRRLFQVPCPQVCKPDLD